MRRRRQWARVGALYWRICLWLCVTCLAGVVLLQFRLARWEHWPDSMAGPVERFAVHKENEDRDVHNRPPRARLDVFIPLLGLKSEKARAIIEHVAVQGWRLAAQRLVSRSILIHVHGLVGNTSHCDPAWADPPGGPYFTCWALPGHCLHRKYQDIPMMDCILQTMAEHISREGEGSSSVPSFAMLANGDLIFSPRELAATVLALASTDALGPQLKPYSENMLLVGQRVDVTLEELGGWKGWMRRGYEVPLHDALAKGTRHPDFGVDYFLMSASMVLRVAGLLPPLLVGRLRWDNLLLARVLVNRTMVTVDATEALGVLHIGPRYSSESRYHAERVGADYNEALTTGSFGELYHLGRIRNAEYALQQRKADDRLGEDDGVHCPVFARRPGAARPDHDALLAIEKAVSVSTANHGLVPFVLLVPVLPRSLSVVLQRGGADIPGVLFVTLDPDTFHALETQRAGRTVLEDAKGGWPSPPVALAWRTFDRLVRMGLVTVAILNATDWMRMDAAGLAEWIDRAAGCDVVLSTREEVLSIGPSAAGLEFWERYKEGKERRGSGQAEDQGRVCTWQVW